MNLKEGNVINILEEDFSNNLEMKNIVDVTDCFVKDHDFSMINSEVNNEITVNKKTQDVHSKMISLNSNMFNLYDSKNNKELLILKSKEDMLAFKNLCNTRNLPNILKGPKTFSKRNTFSFPFEMEDDSYYANDMFENNIFVEENTKNIAKPHNKRKQRHDPLIVQDESINWVVNGTNNSIDSEKKKRKLNSNKTTKLNRNDKRKKKSFLMKNINNKEPVNEVLQKSNVTLDSNMSIFEKDKESSNDLDISFDFITFQEEQIHEDYIDHFDILTDFLKEQQILSENYYNINSNILDCSELECQKSPCHNVLDQIENICESKDIISEDNKDYFYNKAKNCLLFEKCSETKYINNNTTNDFNDSLDNSSNNSLDIGQIFCPKNLTCNSLQNSSNRNQIKHLDKLLLEDEEKYKTYLERKLNNALTSSNTNFPFTNTRKQTTRDYLSNNLEDSTNLRQEENMQQNIQSNVFLDKDLEEKKTSNKYLIVHKLDEELELEFNYEEKNDKEFLNKDNNSNDKKKTKEKVINILQCLLCSLTFSTKRSLALHITGAHGDMYMILCERCGRLFNKMCIFNKHFIHCGCIELPFDCTKCDRKYRHKSSLMHHLKLVHQIECKYDSKKEYKCDICSKTYKKYGAFEKHLDIHVNSKKNLLI